MAQEVVKNTGLGALMARIKTIFKRYALKTQLQEVAEALDQKIDRGSEITIFNLTNSQQRFTAQNLVQFGDIAFSTSSTISKVADTEIKLGKGVYELHYNVSTTDDTVGIKLLVGGVEQQRFISTTSTLSICTVLNFTDEVNYLTFRAISAFSVPSSGVTSLVIRRIS